MIIIRIRTNLFNNDAIVIKIFSNLSMDVSLLFIDYFCS